MTGMTDPMDTLVQLQLALDNQHVSLRPCERHKDIMVIEDQQNGNLRHTYAQINEKKVQAIALFVHTDPVEAAPCFQLSWATIETMEEPDFAKHITEKGIEEFTNTLGMHGITRFYIKSIVSNTNEPSIKIANQLLSDSTEKCTAPFSGEPALQFLRLVNN